MKSRIVNTTRQLLIVTMNSGKALHLAPGEASMPVDGQELNGNGKIEKLLKADMIRMKAAAVESRRTPVTGRQIASWGPSREEIDTRVTAEDVGRETKKETEKEAKKESRRK